MGPILLVIAAIIAIILIFKNWGKITDWFTAKWNVLTAYFKDTSWSDIFKDIGKSILSFLLTPLKTVLKLVSLLPGKLGKLAKTGLEKINDFTMTSGAMKLQDLRSSENAYNKKVLNSAEVNASKKVTETIKKNNISIDIRDKGNNIEKVTNNGDLSIPIKTTPTQGAN